MPRQSAKMGQAESGNGSTHGKLVLPLILKAGRFDRFLDLRFRSGLHVGCYRNFAAYREFRDSECRLSIGHGRALAVFATGASGKS